MISRKQEVKEQLLTCVKNNVSKSYIALPLPEVLIGLRCVLAFGVSSSLFRLWGSHLKYPKKCKMNLDFKKITFNSFVIRNK